jgi:hypothetical protein
MPVTLDTQEAEIRKKVVRSQPGEIVRETLSQKKKTLKRRAGGGWWSDSGYRPWVQTPAPQNKKFYPSH